MGIGTGIVLFVIGAILAFAVNVQVDWISLDLVGYILMAAGVVVFVIGIVMLVRKRQSVSTVRTSVDPANGDQVVQRSSEASDPTITP